MLFKFSFALLLAQDEAKSLNLNIYEFFSLSSHRFSGARREKNFPVMTVNRWLGWWACFERFRLRKNNHRGILFVLSVESDGGPELVLLMLVFPFLLLPPLSSRLVKTFFSHLGGGEMAMKRHFLLPRQAQNIPSPAQRWIIHEGQTLIRMKSQIESFLLISLKAERDDEAQVKYDYLHTRSRHACFMNAHAGGSAHREFWASRRRRKSFSCFNQFIETQTRKQ